MLDIAAQFMTGQLTAMFSVSAFVVIGIVVWRVYFCHGQDSGAGDKARQAQAENYSHLGNSCFINNELDKAHDYYSKALKLNEELGRKEPIAKNYISLGIVLSKKGHSKQARSHWVKARDIFGEMDLAEAIEKEKAMLEELQ